MERMGEELKYNVPYATGSSTTTGPYASSPVPSPSPSVALTLTLTLALALALALALTHYPRPRSVQEALATSGKRPLLHQDNRAKASCPWGGRIDKVSGELIGRNKLGEIWMQVRSEWRGADVRHP